MPLSDTTKPRSTKRTSDARTSEVETDRRALRARHQRGVEIASRPDSSASYCEPQFDLLPDGSPAEVAAESLTAGLLRAAVVRDGSLLVHGLVGAEDARSLIPEIERAFEARDAYGAGDPRDDGLYEPFEPDPGFRPLFERSFVETVGIWTVDSPVIASQVFEILERAGLRELMGEYMGEEPVLAINKCTLRRAAPGPPGPWHQDGAFLGKVRTVNVWLALTPCGEQAPSLDVVSRRIEHILPTGTEGADHDWSLSPEVAEGSADEDAIVRLRFEPGDALLFDDLCVHRPGSEPTMSTTRYAVETWFFGAAGFPDNYIPLALSPTGPRR